MARKITGVSKKANRENLEALAIAQTWVRQFNCGVKMNAELAWVLSNGKFGTEPKYLYASATMAERNEHEGSLAQDINTFDVAKYVVTLRKVGA